MKTKISKSILNVYERYRELLHQETHLPALHVEQSYPATTDKILSMIQSHFEKGVGNLPTVGSVPLKGALPGLVVPHLDFRVGGPTYSYGYHELLNSEPADLYLILGVGHHSPAIISSINKGYRTVLGEVHCDQWFCEKIRKKIPIVFEESLAGHYGEHSIEFAVIYLQALGRLFPKFSDFEIVPVLCDGMQEEIVTQNVSESPYEKFHEILGETISESNRKVCIIGSIDGSHVGPRFQHNFKVDKTMLDQIALLDQALWERVEEGNPESFLNFFHSNQNMQFFDGVGVLYIMLKLFRNIAQFKLLRYDQWFEPRDASVVTLASGVFKKIKNET